MDSLEVQAASTTPFPPTQWSLVRLAMADGLQGADQALNDLYRLYERPIMTYILRKGHPPTEAEDLKQAFFEHLLAKNAFADASGLKVKLRAFLITKLQGFLIDRHRQDDPPNRVIDLYGAAGELLTAEAEFDCPDGETALPSGEGEYICAVVIEIDPIEQ